MERVELLSIHQPRLLVAVHNVWMCGCIYAGLWKGLGARILMIGTLTALQWFIYDTVKVLFRLPRPPPPEMPESLKRKLQAKQGGQ